MAELRKARLTRLPGDGSGRSARRASVGPARRAWWSNAPGSRCATHAGATEAVAKLMALAEALTRDLRAVRSARGGRGDIGMSEALVEAAPGRRSRAPGTAGMALPAVIVDAGPVAVERFLEFFAASIANGRTRAAYGRAVGQFLSWYGATGGDRGRGSGGRRAVPGVLRGLDRQRADAGGVRAGRGAGSCRGVRLGAWACARSPRCTWRPISARIRGRRRRSNSTPSGCCATGWSFHQVLPVKSGRGGAGPRSTW